jgi:hypothetical protein
VCIFSYWIYVTLGCIVHHLPLTTVGIYVGPVGVGQVYVGGVDGNVHVNSRVSRLPTNLLSGILAHSLSKKATASSPALKGIVALHVPSLGVAVWPPTVEGLHGDVGGGVTVVLPSGQVTATARASWSWLLLAVAVLLMLFVLDAVASELELLSAVFVFEFVFVLLAEAFCIIGIILAPTTSIDVIAATIRIPLFVWFFSIRQ